VCCKILQWVAVGCSGLQCVAARHKYTHMHTLQCVAVCCSALLCVAVCCSALLCVAVGCSVLQCVAVRYCVLQWIAVCGCSSHIHTYAYVAVRCSVFHRVVV